MTKVNHSYGDEFGHLTVICESLYRGNDRQVEWWCRCICGKELLVKGRDLRSKHVVSCGCIHPAITHNKSYSSEYHIWHSMKQRCINTNHKHYYNYGGRGITICNEWHEFENFYNDMGDRPSSKHTLERKNNDIGYNKNNCIWILKGEQQNNRRNTIRITIDGVEMTLRDYYKQNNIPYHVGHYAYKVGKLC